MVELIWDGGFLALDASPAQSHAREVTPTRHPIETGGTPTDHLVQEPRELKIEGVFGELPGGGISDAWRTLNRFMDEGTLLKVRTSLESYDSMALVSLSAPRDVATGTALRFTATFQRLDFADSQRIVVEGLGAVLNRGKQGTRPATPEAQKQTSAAMDKGRSLLKSFSGLFGGG